MKKSLKSIVDLVKRSKNWSKVAKKCYKSLKIEWNFYKNSLKNTKKKDEKLRRNIKKLVRIYVFFAHFSMILTDFSHIFDHHFSIFQRFSRFLINFQFLLILVTFLLNFCRFLATFSMLEIRKSIFIHFPIFFS